MLHILQIASHKMFIELMDLKEQKKKIKLALRSKMYVSFNSIWASLIHFAKPFAVSQCPLKKHSSVVRRAHSPPEHSLFIQRRYEPVVIPVCGVHGTMKSIYMVSTFCSHKEDELSAKRKKMRMNIVSRLTVDVNLCLAVIIIGCLSFHAYSKKTVLMYLHQLSQSRIRKPS